MTAPRPRSWCPPRPAAPGPAKRLRGLGVGVGLISALTACAFGTPSQQEGGVAPRLSAPSRASAAAEPPSAVASVLATDLAVPWGVSFLPDGSALVTERDSRRILRAGPDSDPDGLVVRPVQTIAQAQPAGEGGLLGIAVSPHYAADGLVFIYYTTATDNRIARLRLGGHPEPIVTGIPASPGHDGGALAFGPDGFLYAATGDASHSPSAQDPTSLAGKILRMTADGKPAPGNPHEGSLIWSQGHRNVQGLAWDGQGRMFATELGQNAWDEINWIEPGKDYGWPAVEGAAGDPRYVDPLIAWPTGEASCSGLAALSDVLVAACLRGQRLWMLRLDDSAEVVGTPTAGLVRAVGRLRAATVAPDGSLWVTTSNRDGHGTPAPGDDKILRIVISGAAGASQA